MNNREMESIINSYRGLNSSSILICHGMDEEFRLSRITYSSPAREETHIQIDGKGYFLVVIYNKLDHMASFYMPKTLKRNTLGTCRIYTKQRRRK